MEVKRPGALAWSRAAVEAALEQVRRYADEQKVKCVAVSDGVVLYAGDVVHGGIRDRVFVSLEAGEPPETLWWLSVHGIYRPRTDARETAPRLLAETTPPEAAATIETCEDLLHPKYKIPARCFAYVGHAGDPTTWKLPYCNLDGGIDVKRVPKAIQAILTNYRGTKVSSIPESDIPDVLVRLGCAAARFGKMPGQSGETAPAYHQLAEVLEQLGRLNEITGG